MMKKSLYTLFLLLVIVYAAPLYAQPLQRDTGGLAAEMAVMFKVYASKQYAFDMRYTFASALKPEKIVDSTTGRLEVADGQCYYTMGNSISITNGRYNIILQSTMKKMHVSKPRSGDQTLKVMQAGFPVAAVKSWSVIQQDNERSFHAEFLPGLPFISLDVKRDMAGGYLTEMRYLIPANQLQRFGSGHSNEDEEFGDYAIVRVTYTQDKKYKPDMAVFDELRYFRKTETTLEPAAAFSGYQVFKASPDL
ncbi:hypothetical protein [Chitinophaga qingshengii]|uniref:DUF3108 domain-containing protein n=1 Tax=Chitinophaga qingshengii TaxID=1569794 RepID=A0ABR7TJ30_9BACT|nr:hypothetical protein [Chitinophaga qingshengii]MBC9929531.1 hypothetical protein [Chitinophaga qingshengii]